jgi:uncharacterized protein (DUF2147 family)
MKMITLAAAAILLAGTAAHAGSGISFEINGQKIHVEAPRNCDALSCIRITAPGLDLKSLNLKGLNPGGSNDDDDGSVASTSAAPTTSPAPTAQTPAPQPPSPIVSSTSPAPVAPSVVTSTTPASATIAPANPVPVVATAPVPSDPAATAAAPGQQPAPVAAAPTPASATPLGVWATEENKGNVRIEACGSNLCGYADKTGEMILINMKPSDNKWVGRIRDPDHGGNYDSTIAMKGPNVLRVQGCAFGGMFCGGQTWKRVS